MNGDAGRNCPLAYRYTPADLAAAAAEAADTLYLVGGLYGNLQALDALESLLAQESGPVTVCFNGDIHWFDAEPAWFAEVQRRALGTPGWMAMQGNVEAELCTPGDEAGCGCAYPEGVEQGVVDRSNAIHQRLKAVAQAQAGAVEGLAALPRWRRYQVGGVSVGVVHGDAWSLSGWDFDRNRVLDPAHQPRLHQAFEGSGCAVLGCSHTCAPVLWAQVGRVLINNGAAGMGNAAGDARGLVSRIATTPSPGPVVQGTRLEGVHIDALALDFDVATCLRRFDAVWPPGSPAALSYRQRLLAGG